MHQNFVSIFQLQQHHLPARNIVKLKAGKIPNTPRNKSKKEQRPLKRKIPQKFIQQENSGDLTADKNVLHLLIKLLTQILLLNRKLLIKSPRDPEKVMRVNVKKGNSKRKKPLRQIVRTAFWIYLLNNELSKYFCQ